MPALIGAIDQGTTSTRFIVFDRHGAIVALAQKEHAQIFPKPGWVEHDAQEIWRNTQDVIAEALAKAGLTRQNLAAVGITNQRETTRALGPPAPGRRSTTRSSGRTPAWMASWPHSPRDGGPDRLRARTGLPLATLLFRPQAALALGHRARRARSRPRLARSFFGTVDRGSCGT